MGSEVCPYCKARETCESDRDYPHWRQFDCGSLLINTEEFHVEQSQKCRVRERDLMVAAARDDFGNAVVSLIEKDARIAALSEELERVKEGVAKSLDVAYLRLKENDWMNVSHGQWQRISDARNIITAQINFLRTGSTLGDFPTKAKEPT